MSVNEQNSDIICSKICEIVPKGDTERILAALTSITNALDRRPRAIRQLAWITKEFLERVMPHLDSDALGKFFLKHHFWPSSFVFSTYNIYIHELMQLGFLDPSLIIPMFCDFWKQRPDYDNEALTFFCWFCIEIEAFSQEVFDEFVDCFRARANVPTLLSRLKLWFNIFDELRENDWKIQRSFMSSAMGFEAWGPLILKDDVEGLKNLEGLDVNKTLQPSIFYVSRAFNRFSTLLQISALLGSAKCFDYLVSHGAVFEPSHYGQRKLGHYVVAGGNKEIIDMARKYNCDFAGTLAMAATYHHNDLFFEMIERDNVHLNDWDEVLGHSIHQAVKSGNFFIVRYCLDQGVDPNILTVEKWTPLHIACQYNCPDVLRYLLSHKGINVNARDSARRTPLHFACETDYSFTLPLLLLCEAVDVNAKNKDVMSPLLMAAMRGKHARILDLLVRPDLDHESIDGMGMTALHWAVKNQHLKSMEVLLGKSRIGVNATCDDGNTPLHLACANGFIGGVDLLSRQSDVNFKARNDWGNTCFHEAVLSGNIELVQSLLKRWEIDVNAQNAEGMTGLHIAALSGQIQMIEVLMTCKRVNVTLKDNLGRMAVRDGGLRKITADR
jgi:ankyrin repeat protein